MLVNVDVVELDVAAVVFREDLDRCAAAVSTVANRKFAALSGIAPGHS